MSVMIEEVTPTLPVTNLDRAVAFYQTTMGLRPVALDECEAILGSGPATRIILSLREDPPRAENTAASFSVADLPAAMEGLRQRGVIFHDYNLPELQTVDGVYDDGECQTAWFNDSEGNVLCVCTGPKLTKARLDAAALAAPV